MDSFDKGWFVLQTYSGYENKVKENLLQRAQTYNMLDNILRVEIPTQTVQVEKNGKKKEVEEINNSVVKELSQKYQLSRYRTEVYPHTILPFFLESPKDYHKAKEYLENN